MSARPLVVAFDIIETTISLDPLRSVFVEAGLPNTAMDHWLSIGLRDAFAMGAAGDYQPFMTLLKSGLSEIFAIHGLKPSDDFAARIEGAMSTAPARTGAKQALRLLHDGGVRIFALTNGSKKFTEKLLRHNGLLGQFEEVISTDQVGAPKPQPQVYRYLLERAGSRPSQTALVATHGWDLHGAGAVGLTTAFVSHDRPFPAALRSPDLQASKLPLLAQELLSLG